MDFETELRKLIQSKTTDLDKFKCDITDAYMKCRAEEEKEKKYQKDLFNKFFTKFNSKMEKSFEEDSRDLLQTVFIDETMKLKHSIETVMNLE